MKKTSIAVAIISAIGATGTYSIATNSIAKFENNLESTTKQVAAKRKIASSFYEEQLETIEVATKKKVTGNPVEILDLEYSPIEEKKVKETKKADSKNKTKVDT